MNDISNLRTRPWQTIYGTKNKTKWWFLQPHFEYCACHPISNISLQQLFACWFASSSKVLFSQPNEKQFNPPLNCNSEARCQLADMASSSFTAQANGSFRFVQVLNFVLLFYSELLIEFCLLIESNTISAHSTYSYIDLYGKFVARDDFKDWGEKQKSMTKEPKQSIYL